MVALVLFFFVCDSATMTALAEETNPLLESCLSKGFNAMQLSCDTCVVLSSSTMQQHHKACLECCQSYKSLDSKTSRYQAAILSHSPGSSEETDKFVEEDAKSLSLPSLQIKKSSSSGGGDFFMMRQPSVLFFFDSAPPSDMASWRQQAKEEIYLDGWSRDDLKDMITTLLPSSSK